MFPPVTYLTDCADANAQARLATRMGALFGQTPLMLPIEGRSPELRAGLTLLDVLRTTHMLGEAGFPTLTLVNIAPRDGQWSNGAPFCYFRYGQHLVCSTFNPDTLSLVRLHLGVESVWVTDVRTVVQHAADNWADFSQAEVDAIATTQFRSLWYLPLLAKWVVEGREVPAEEVTIPMESLEEPRVAVIDSFGNAKLTCQASTIDHAPGKMLRVSFLDHGVMLGTHELTCYRTLSDVPQGESALITGSSGVDFVELVVASGSAAQRYGLSEGINVRFDLVGGLGQDSDDHTVVSLDLHRAIPVVEGHPQAVVNS